MRLNKIIATVVIIAGLSGCNNQSDIKVDKVDVMQTLRTGQDYVMATTKDGNEMRILFSKGYGEADHYVTEDKNGIRRIALSMDDGVNLKAIMIFMDVNCQTKEVKTGTNEPWIKDYAPHSLLGYGVAYACQIPTLKRGY